MRTMTSVNRSRPAGSSRRWLFGLVLGLGLACPLLTGAQAPTPRPPNILFCIADDWGWPHAGAYGDPVVRTPTFNAVARQGVLFTHAFSTAPSCTPSRAGILTGRAVHQLREGANLWSTLSAEFVVYPDLVERAGYRVGATGKGWGPGDWKAGGRARPPAGPQFKDFSAFLATVPKGESFCFWFGSTDPHRPYEPGSGKAAGLDLDRVPIPPQLPDHPAVRSDICDYYAEVERFDRDVGELLGLVERRGESSHTLVVITGDNGWPFPRGKANVYDAGSRQPLAVRWPEGFKGGLVSDALVSLYDLVPTFLEAAGVARPAHLAGQSLLPLCRGERQDGRDAVFLERERHAQVRAGNRSYPVRAMRTRDFLFIKNLRPALWPAGDPELVFAVGPFGDCDPGPTKERILSSRDTPVGRPLFELAFGKRPAEELYDLRHDPHQIKNVASEASYAAVKKQLDGRLEQWRRDAQDPRVSDSNDDDFFDRVTYRGARARQGNR